MSLVKNPATLTNIYRRTLQRFRLSTPEEYPIIQEFIKGITVEWGMLFENGALKAKFSFLNPRRFYYIEYEDPEFTESLCRLAEYLDWHGMISGTYILEDVTGLTYLTDINPRFWGGLQFAITSGIEFPYLLYRITIDKPVEPVIEHKKGLKARWLWGDLSEIPKYVQTNEWNQVLNILTSRAPLTVWDRNDPIPFLTLPIYPLTQLFRTGTTQPLTEKYSQTTANEATTKTTLNSRH